MNCALLCKLLLGRHSSKSLKFRRFKSDRDEIWKDCLSKHSLIDRQISDTTSYFQDGVHDVLMPLAATVLMQQRPPAAR